MADKKTWFEAIKEEEKDINSLNKEKTKFIVADYDGSKLKTPKIKAQTEFTSRFTVAPNITIKNVDFIVNKKVKNPEFGEKTEKIINKKGKKLPKNFTDFWGNNELDTEDIKEDIKEDRNNEKDNQEGLLNKAINMIDNAENGILVDSNGNIVKDMNYAFQRMQRIFDSVQQKELTLW